MDDIKALSLWKANEPATTIHRGRLLNPTGQPYYVAKLPRIGLQSTTLPDPSDVEDYCVTLTTTNDTTIHSEVTDHDTQHSHARLTIPDPDHPTLHIP